MPERTLELFVRSHSHALLHVVGLVARRGFHLGAIVSDPPDDRGIACVRLRIVDDPRVSQLVKQLARLEDVVSVAERLPADPVSRGWPVGG